MREHYYLLIVAAMLVLPHASSGEDADPLEIVRTGLAAYKEEGAKAAVAAWLDGGPLESSKEATSQANLLLQIEDFYGPYIEFHVVHERRVSPSTHFAYVVLDYKNGPVFAAFIIFKTPEGLWILPRFSFHTEASQVWPTSLYAQ